MRIRVVISILLFSVSFQARTNDPIKQKISPVKILITIKADHAYSNPTIKDHFELNLSGKSVTEGKIKLTISNLDHKQIFTDSFPSFDLLYDFDAMELGGSSKLSAKKKETIIRNSMNNFFTENTFKYPAINANEKYDEGDNIDQSIWNDIHSDKTAIGFIYQHGYEGTYGIAFSKKMKKTVLYYYSD